MDFLSEINLMMMIQYNTILFWLKRCQGAIDNEAHTRRFTVLWHQKLDYTIWNL